MKKNEVKIRSLCTLIETNNARINEIADACEKEQRQRTEAEDIEYRKLTRETDLAHMRLTGLRSAGEQPQAQSLTRQVRSALTAGHRPTIMLRDGEGEEATETPSVPGSITTSSVAETGLIPTTQQEFIKPLRGGLIWDKLGIKVYTNCKGKLRWPTHSAAVAQWRGEGAAVINSEIDFGKLEMSGTPVSVYVKTTREALYNTDNEVERIIYEELPKAISDAINAKMLAGTASGEVKGPISQVMASADALTASVPTRKELLKLKAKLAKKGLADSFCAFVMREDMKSELEDTKVDAGSGRFVCENGRIFGYPVLTSDDVDENVVAFGNWSYQAAGFFGPMTILVDPYTDSTTNEVRFILHANFGTVTLRPEAFAVAKYSK